MRYEDLPGIRWSHLKRMGVSPKHYRYGIDSEDESESKALRYGIALHTLILEPEHFTERHPIFVGAARTSKKWKEFKAEHPGTDILLEKEFIEVSQMAEAIRSHDLAMSHLRHGVKERVIQWTDPDTGLKCKGRCDSVNGTLKELKTCNGMSFPHEQFEKHALKLGYDGQSAYYSDGLAANGYEAKGLPTMIVVESAQPFDVAVYTIKDEIIEHGRAKYKRFLQRVKTCMEQREWPGVCGDEPLYLGLPPWVENEALPKVTFGGAAI